MQLKTEAKRKVYHYQVKALYVMEKVLNLLTKPNSCMKCWLKKKKKNLCFVGFATRVAGVWSLDVLVLMWRVVTCFCPKQND